MIPTNPGGLKDVPDPRDYQYSQLGASSLPFDWSKGFDIEVVVGEKIGNPAFKLPVKDQNGSYSCGGQAASTYHSVLEAMNTGSFEERSAKFVYCQTAQPGGGSYGRDLVDLLIKDGCCKETVLLSYDNGLPPEEPFMTDKSALTSFAYEDAVITQVRSYANVISTIDEFAKAIQNNYGLFLGIDGEDNGTWKSAFPKPPMNKVWGHWLYAGKAKMIDGKKYIGIQNSWGSFVGENGWQWIGEDYFNSGHVWNGWTMVFNVKPTHLFNQDMKYGDYGAEVQYLQKVLRTTGDFTYPYITGYYGKETSNAVYSFQKRNKIIKMWEYMKFFGLNSKVGPKTRAALNSLPNK